MVGVCPNEPEIWSRSSCNALDGGLWVAGVVCGVAVVVAGGFVGVMEAEEETVDGGFTGVVVVGGRVGVVVIGSGAGGLTTGARTLVVFAALPDQLRPVLLVYAMI